MGLGLVVVVAPQRAQGMAVAATAAVSLPHHHRDVVLPLATAASPRCHRWPPCRRQLIDGGHN